MNLNQLYYFKTLAELEHYTKAAGKAEYFSADAQPLHFFHGKGTGGKFV